MKGDDGTHTDGTLSPTNAPIGPPTPSPTAVPTHLDWSHPPVLDQKTTAPTKYPTAAPTKIPTTVPTGTFTDAFGVHNMLPGDNPLGTSKGDGSGAKTKTKSQPDVEPVRTGLDAEIAALEAGNRPSP